MQPTVQRLSPKIQVKALTFGTESVRAYWRQACAQFDSRAGGLKLLSAVILRSDPGSQYCAPAYKALMREHGLTCSMSAKGNC